jgi:nucleotide-binding universal stress UspA family protein
MIEIRRILCPIDFSDHSRRAFDHAVAMARWYGATITVLHVFSPAPVAAYAAGTVFLQPIALTALDRDLLLAQTSAFIEQERTSGVAIEAVVREGNTAAGILDQAILMDADLLVLGTHGRSGFDRLLLGSVTEKVLRRSRCPVLTVPARLPAAPASPVLYKRILCPLDFSDASLQALAYARSIAQEADATLTVLHVVSHEFEHVADLASLAYGGMTVDDFLKTREEALQKRLQEAVGGATEGCRVESMMTYGKPWREVLRIATERATDVIVMGVQGRGAADLLLFGSTTQHVVREAACPVLTLRYL